MVVYIQADINTNSCLDIFADVACPRGPGWGLILKHFCVPKVLPELSSERAMARGASNLADVQAADTVYKAAAERLVVTKNRKNPAGGRRKHVRYRVKSYKLAQALDSNLSALGLGGFRRLKVADADMAGERDAENWVCASINSDKGSDCLCLRSFLLNHLKLNIDWSFDTSHGAHHSAGHAMVRSGLRVHSYMMSFAYNVGLGEWHDGTRREQIGQSMKDTMLTSAGNASNDVLFQAALPFFEKTSPPADGLWSTDYEQSLYDDLKRQSIWDQSETRLSNCKFFGYIYRFKHREAR